MLIDSNRYAAMPAHIRRLFVALPNPSRDEVVALFPGEGDKSAARFFYCSKASRKDRDEGLDGFDVVKCKTKSGGGLPNDGRSASSDGGMRANTHPTVKPTDLMRYLFRLVTPPGGVVLDPFMGSGSTGKAAVLEGFRFIGAEREAEYIVIARARIDAVQPQLFGVHNPA